MKVAIVNDVETSLHVLRHLVERNSGWHVIWSAKDGAEAVEKCGHEVPDMILMDLLMPVMNGVESTRQIMQSTPCTILVVTAGVDKNAPLVYEALGAGALDAVDMPGTDSESIQALLHKMQALDRLVSQVGKKEAQPVPLQKAPQHAKDKELLIAIGASTGGPAVVSQLLEQLPATLSAGIVVIQHIDKEYADGFAQWLDSQTALNVRVARNGDSPAPGSVLVAATNDHLVLTAKGKLKYTPEPVENVYRPSVDEFYASTALHWPGEIIAVLLTGMGRDGARGMLALRRLGHTTLAQSEKTCSVYGMPQAAVKIGAVMHQLSPEEIGHRLLQLTELHQRS